MTTALPDLSDMTPGERQAILDQFTEILRRPETIEALLKTIFPHLREGERTLVYILDKYQRIGHLLQEPYMVQTMFGAEYDRLLILTGPMEGSGCNPWVTELWDDKITNVVTHNPILPMLGILEAGRATIGPMDLLLMDPQSVISEFVEHKLAGRPVEYQSMSDRLRERGEAWFQQLGVPSDAPVAMVHVRDMSYMSDRTHHSFRAADFINYLPAIEWLLEQGFWVFRLGDAASERLDLASARVVDVPHLSNYEGFMDVYLAGRADLPIMMPSGPEALVRVQGRSALMVNELPSQKADHNPENLLLFRPVYHADSGKRMSYRELLARKVPTLGRKVEFEAAGIRVGQNSPEEILMAVQEFLDRRSGTFAVDSAVQARFLEIGAAYEAETTDQLGAYGCAHAGWGQLCQSTLPPGWLED